MIKPINISFPKSVFITEYGNLEFDLDSPLKNMINIDGIDFVPYFIDLATKGNKGGNSFLLSLHNAQDFEEVGFSKPVLALKISKTPFSKWSSIKTERFRIEVEALENCVQKDHKNIVKMYHKGQCHISKRLHNGNTKWQFFDFYTLEYAKSDLKKYIETNTPTLFERLNLCIEIANGLKELEGLGYYHRDLKPDNIFIIDNAWKIGDLGLLDHREIDFKLDRENELIGPRGWYCPEAMNKFLTEEKGFPYPFDCKIDHQSDIFQLGSIFWYILQGNAPVGCIKPIDFYIRDINLYSILRTMLNQSKKKRYNKIEEVINLLKPIHYKYFKSAS